MRALICLLLIVMGCGDDVPGKEGAGGSDNGALAPDTSGAGGDALPDAPDAGVQPDPGGSADTALADTPGPDTPGPDTPVTDTPGADTPEPDTTAIDTPGPDTEQPDTTGPETPGPDTPPCVPDCAGKTCGPDGCGDVCGSCGQTYQCEDGQCVAGPCTPRTGSLSFTALEADNEGSGAWNTDGTGPEPAKTGHELTWTASSACPVKYAYYYLASRDYVDAAAKAAGHVTAVADGFPLLAEALAANGLEVSDITFRFALTSLGADAEGADWSYDPTTTTETRAYTGGTLSLLVSGEVALESPMPPLTAAVQHGDVNNCFDDKISGYTAYSVLADASAASSPAVQQVASALLADIGAFCLNLSFDSLQPVGQEEFASNGRKGAYFEAQSGALEIGSVPISECQ